jgi:hypothetical protein
MNLFTEHSVRSERMAFDIEISRAKLGSEVAEARRGRRSSRSARSVWAPRSTWLQIRRAATKKPVPATSAAAPEPTASSTPSGVRI